MAFHPISSAGSIFFDPETLRIFADAAVSDLSQETLETSDPAGHREICRTGDATAYLPATGRPRLSRLTLHISNSCNLACSYCYASGGDYGLGRKLMKSDNAIELLSDAFNAFDIDSLMFFGGEPSLNVDAILDCCIFVKELHARGLIREMPRFGVISNLAGSGEKFDLFLAVCRAFDFSITVSIDGPPDIHDANRPRLKGGGSFEQVRKNYFRARKIGIPVDIQCTYTSNHVERGISILDLMKFFKSEFETAHSHIAPASCSPISDEQPAQKAIIESYCEAIKYMVATLNTPDHLTIDIGQRLIQAFVHKENIAHYCPAGNSELTIGPDGQLSPCFMFVGHESFDMGKIEKGDRWLSSHGEAILESIRKNGKDQHPVCRTCWARNVCTGCIGSDYLATKTLSAKPQCAFTKATAAETIVRLVEVVQGLPVGIYGDEQRDVFAEAGSADEFAMSAELCAPAT
ncbi:MAG: radical SAM protein [Pseudorhodoplanes sp.]|nr:radical SAM protein [Pseudorhodoplanes sp.]